MYYGVTSTTLVEMKSVSAKNEHARELGAKMVDLQTDHWADEYAKLNCLLLSREATVKSPIAPAAPI